jgi:hypothetical protein
MKGKIFFGLTVLAKARNTLSGTYEPINYHFLNSDDLFFYLLRSSVDAVIHFLFMKKNTTAIV